MKPHLVVEENVGQQVLLGVPPGKAPDVAVLVYIEIGKIYRPFNKPHDRASLWNDGITLAQDGLLYRSKDLRSSAFSRFKYLKPNTGAAI